MIIELHEKSLQIEARWLVAYHLKEKPADLFVLALCRDETDARHMAYEYNSRNRTSTRCWIYREISPTTYITTGKG